jgi:outer membrane protein assembly factor BamB
MKLTKRKASVIAISVALILSMLASTTLISTAGAHTPSWTFPTVAYIQAMPNPIGVGQTITVYCWLDLTFGGAGRALGETTSFAGVYNNYRFHNYQVVITAPNGTQQTMTFATISDSTSSQLFLFTPTSVGTYTFNFTFPGQKYNQYPGGYDPTSQLVNDTYLPSTASTNLTVLATPVNAATTGFPLPSQYWTRPIYGENSNWYTISSDWLGTGNPQFWAENYIHNLYVPDAIGSQTAHVMWTKQIQNGGTVGGNPFAAAQGVAYFEGSAYNNRYTNPIIMDGFLYYTEPVDYTGSNAGRTYCVDLRTGQVIWSSTQIPALSFGYIYNLWNYNQHGTFPPILFTANFAQAFDGFTGDPLFNVTAVPTGNSASGPNGEQLRYVFANAGTSTNPQWYLAQWNSSRLWEMFTNPWTGVNVNSPTQYNDSYTNGTTLSANDAMNAAAVQPVIGVPAGNDPNQPATYRYVIYGNVVNSSSSLYSYDWNVSVPWLNTMGAQTVHTLANGTVIYGTTSGNPNAQNPVTVMAAFNGDMLLCRNGSQPSIGTSFYATSWTPYTYFAVNLNASKGPIGSILWMQTLQPPPNNVTVLFGGVDPVSRVFYETWKEDMQYLAYSMDTGAKLWGPTQPQTALDYYGNDFGGNLDGQCAYGKLYSVGFAGILYAWDAKTGNLLWTYGNGGVGNSTNSGFNSPYGDYPTFIAAIGNGIVYTETTEHTVLDPIYKGALARAINATDGTEIWQLSAYTGGGGSTTSYAIADGFSTWFNGYDNSIYVVGRGPSAITVSAQAAVGTGNAVVISGSVTDISAGTKQNQQAADFPHGVPVSSDVSMKDWMAYVYQQKPEPTNFTGVLVNLYVLDSNGNYRQIGTAKTDEDGMYTLTYVPEIAGNFTVYANFAGTQGYWPSNAEATFAVLNAAATTVPTTTTAVNQVSMADLTTLLAVAVIVIVLAIAVVGALILRKRP